MTRLELDERLAVAVGFHMDQGMLVDRAKCPRTMGNWSERIEQAVSMAEELRKSGRITDWSVGFEGKTYMAVVAPGGGGKWDFAPRCYGDSPEHALTLALLGALTRLEETRA